MFADFMISTMITAGFPAFLVVTTNTGSSRVVAEPPGFSRLTLDLKCEIRFGLLRDGLSS